MTLRIGYFEGLNIKADNVFEAYDKMPIYKEHRPKNDTDDCYRVSIIDGALFIEMWQKENLAFHPLVCTNKFTVKF